MPLYHEDMHKHIQQAMDDLGITVYHNERLEDMDALERLRDEAVQAESKEHTRGKSEKKGRKMIRLRLKSGREVESDLQVSAGVRYSAGTDSSDRSSASANTTTTSSSRARSQVCSAKRDRSR
jgi:hypothetical protein